MRVCVCVCLCVSGVEGVVSNFSSPQNLTVFHLENCEPRAAKNERVFLSPPPPLYVTPPLPSYPNPLYHFRDSTHLLTQTEVDICRKRNLSELEKNRILL